jgi:hypothetical protein
MRLMWALWTIADTARRLVIGAGSTRVRSLQR